MVLNKPLKFHFSYSIFNVLVFHQFISAEEEAEGLKEAPVEPKPTLPEGVIMEGFSADDEKAIEAGKESFAFQAEVNRLMDIIINSLCKSYSKIHCHSCSLMNV